MKKVISGKVYDTSTAEALHEWGNAFSKSDFKWCEETLYRTTKGAFFLHGEGGAMTRYARPVGNMRTGGECIIVMSKEEAMQWLEEHDGEGVLTEHFAGEIEEG